uniref:Protein Vpu n=1 Tax=Human immunodeficiency virus type 1 TaxID=11676 RepID=A0A076V8U7_HV1|nr:vpu protein [Human immunodeficiency virus 1]
MQSLPSLQPLQILAIVALVVVGIIAIVVWSIVLIEYRKLRRQKKINRLLDRIRERAEDSGNESEGDAEELAALGDMGPLIIGNIYKNCRGLCRGQVGHSLLWGTCVERSKNHSILCIRC